MKFNTIALMGILSLACVQSSRANEQGGGGGACHDDMKQHCGSVMTGGGNMHECMKAHESEFSQPCKDMMAERKKHVEAKMKEVEAACDADLKQFCSNVTPGEGRQMACLKAYEDKISAPCKEKFGAIKSERKEMREKKEMKTKKEKK